MKKILLVLLFMPLIGCSKDKIETPIQISDEERMILSSYIITSIIPIVVDYCSSIDSSISREVKTEFDKYKLRNKERIRAGMRLVSSVYKHEKYAAYTTKVSEAIWNVHRDFGDGKTQTSVTCIGYKTTLEYDLNYQN